MMTACTLALIFNTYLNLFFLNSMHAFLDNENSLCTCITNNIEYMREFKFNFDKGKHEICVSKHRND